MTHGETDNGSADYESALVKLLADGNADLAAITGQTRKIATPIPRSTRSRTAMRAQASACTLHKRRGGSARLALPTSSAREIWHQYPGHSNGDGVHLSATAYQLLGEKVGQVYYEREVLGRDWRPLQPISVERRGDGVRVVFFRVPVPPPQIGDMALDPPAIAEWVRARGFELLDERRKHPRPERGASRAMR